MDNGNCIFDILDYNKGTWWNCDDDTITNYSGYPDNVYEYSSNENEQKKGKCLLWIYQIGLCQYYKQKDKLLNPSHNIFVLGNKYPKGYWKY